MAFESTMYPGEKVIDDDTPDEELGIGQEDAPGMPRGRAGSSEGYAGVAGVQPFPSELLIDPSEYEPRIKEMEERKSRVSDRIKQLGVKYKNQQQLNYCWMFAPTHVVEVLYAMQNGVYVSLSPASVGAQVTGFRNVGGYGKEAVEGIVRYGLVPSANWPDTALDRRYLTTENAALAKNYTITNWTVTQPRNFAQVFSMLLRRNPGAGGFNWWSHEVSLIDPVWKNGQPGIRIRNQWVPDGVHPWGDDNYAILQGSRMNPDDAIWPLLVSAS